MRLTTNVPKSGGRVIIYTKVKTERIDAAVGLVRRHVSRDSRARSKYQIKYILCEVEEGMGERMGLGDCSLV